MKNLVFLLAALALAACSTVNVTITNRASGSIARTTVDGGGNTGTMQIILDGVPYSGQWVVMRQTGGGGILLSKYAHAEWSTGPITGMGRANLVGTNGNALICEFNYGMSSPDGVGGFGVCEDNKKQVYDFFLGN